MSCICLFATCVAFSSEVRVAERSVEGRHSRIHNIQKRAPRANTGYISLDLRFPYLQKVSPTRPEMMRGVANMIQGIETHSGFVDALMWATESVGVGSDVVFDPLRHSEGFF